MVKPVLEIQEEAKQFILRNKFDKALDLVNEFIKNYELSNSPLEKHLILISKEYFDIRERVIKGILSYDEVRKIEANLTDRFLVLVDDLYKLNDKVLLVKNQESDVGLVSADFYLNTQLNSLITKILSSDDKISDLKITIENKKVEISRTKNQDKVQKLTAEIEVLKSQIKLEQDNYHSIKSEYDDLKIKYDDLENKNNREFKTVKCGNCNVDLEGVSKCENCGYENDDLKMIRLKLDSFKVDYELIIENQKDKEDILKEVKSTNSSILQYLDDLNRKLNMIEKRLS